MPEENISYSVLFNDCWLCGGGAGLLPPHGGWAGLLPGSRAELPPRAQEDEEVERARPSPSRGRDGVPRGLCGNHRVLSRH